MPLHVYECSNGHVHEVLEGVNDDRTGKRCAAACEVSDCKEQHTCRAQVKLSAAVSTATPILKAGRCGGFYKPNA